MRILLAATVLFFGTAQAQTGYVPGPHPAWDTRAPQDLGLDPEKLQAAIDFAVENETKFPPELAEVADVRDLSLTVPLTWAREPFSSPIGPFEPRAASNGIILKDGYIVAEWGETDAVDMTFSISKTFLSHMAGLAFDRGMLDPDTAMLDTIDPPTEDFALPHNRPITWDQMLRQTSGWIGTLWGKPWWADRPQGEEPWSDLAAGPPEPGEHWEYNDVRVNALALALTHLWDRPLPEVLKEGVMDPIGASDDWHWEGYENSTIDLGGEPVEVVSGGGHWGGGMFVSARDLARLGLLGLRRGEWGGERILSEDWVERATTPTGPEPGYGYMNWFLNTGQERFPAAREDAVAYLGAGTNMVFIDYEHDLVAVVRWLDRETLSEFIGLLLDAAAD
ncbi:serine hydrolase domain-containing protein [Parvularcula oceani]|uniref:serine hydrolase domain-containing protein n=1 Tax=Parvularcula oceani TaxID=1247963 RepID=UPI00056D0BD6|nr:serine hydrolase [Parvularcula oceani]